MNNRINAKWGKAVKSEIPDYFESGEDFSIKIAMGDRSYQVLFNEVPLSKSFPYRNELSDVKSIRLDGGSNGFYWICVLLNGELKFGKFNLQDFISED